MLIDGFHVPLTVPFARDGSCYLRKLEGNIGRYSLSPVAGLVALGPGSEVEMLSDEEIGDVLRVVGRSAAPEKVLVAGINSNSVRGALKVAEHAAEAGFDAVLLGAPSTWPQLAADELTTFFQAVADRSPLPLLLWSEIAAPSMQLSLELINELARHRNVIGLYDADLTLERHRAISEATRAIKREVTVTAVFAPVTRRMEAAAAQDGSFVSAESLGGGASVIVSVAKPALTMRTKTVGFQIMAAGRCVELLPLLEAGAAGAMPELSACAPQGCYEVFAAFKDGDPALAAEKAERIRSADGLMQQVGVAGVKYGCDLNGYYGGLPRLPRLGLTAEQKVQVEAVLRQVRN
jgi:4-hydroxy-2-oxoglutarate aldolase